MYVISLVLRHVVVCQCGSYSFTADQLPYSLIMRLRDLILNHKITANMLQTKLQYLFYPVCVCSDKEESTVLVGTH